MCSACERGQGKYCNRKSEAVELTMTSKHGKRTTKRAAGQSKKYDEEFPVTVPANGWRRTLKRKATETETSNAPGGKIREIEKTIMKRGRCMKDTPSKLPGRRMREIVRVSSNLIHESMRLFLPNMDNDQHKRIVSVALTIDEKSKGLQRRI